MATLKQLGRECSDTAADLDGQEIHGDVGVVVSTTLVEDSLGVVGDTNTQTLAARTQDTHNVLRHCHKTRQKIVVWFEIGCCQPEMNNNKNEFTK